MPDRPSVPAPAVSEARKTVQRAAVEMAMMARDKMGDGSYTRACDELDRTLDTLIAQAFTEARRVVENDLLMTDPRRGLLEMRVWLYALVAKVGTVRLTEADLAGAPSVLIQHTTDPDGTITLHVPAALAGLTTTETER